MSHSAHEHLEHAEHHASDPFDKRVAVTMAIIAALIAGIAMVGHRTHNEVLQLQGDANRIGTDAAAAEVEKSNYFAWYQSKKQRQNFLEVIAAETSLLVPADKKEAADKQVAEWRAKAKDYDKPDPERHESLPELIEKGNHADKKAHELRDKAKNLTHEAEHIHHQADRLDIAHLLAELGLVLCSVTILTKRKGWWFAGIVAAVVSLGAVGSMFFIPHDSHTEPIPAKAAH